MSLKLEEIQKKIDQAKQAEAQATKALAPLTEARQKAGQALKDVQEAESELTRKRQLAEVALADAAAAEGKAQLALKAKTDDVLRWQQAFERALEE